MFLQCVVNVVIQVVLGHLGLKERKDAMGLVAPRGVKAHKAQKVKRGCVDLWESRDSLALWVTVGLWVPVVQKEIKGTQVQKETLALS